MSVRPAMVAAKPRWNPATMYRSTEVTPSDIGTVTYVRPTTSQPGPSRCRRQAAARAVSPGFREVRRRVVMTSHRLGGTHEGACRHHRR
jgi:hypothetical protein